MAGRVALRSAPSTPATLPAAGDATSGELGRAPKAAPVQAPIKIAAVKAPLTNLQRIKKIEQVLESLRPALMADGGDVELVEVIGNTAYVNMTGACNGCQMAAMTIAGIQQRLMEVMGEFIKVVPATEMSKLVTIEVA